MKFHLQAPAANVITGLGPGWVRVGGIEYCENLVLTADLIAKGWAPGGFAALDAADFATLHYLMQPYHALEIALLNEKRAFEFFSGLVRRASTDKVKRAAKEMAGEEAEHVRLIEDWIRKVPPPEAHWDVDLDPPRYSD